MNKSISHRKWALFISQKKAKIGVTFFFILFFFSMTAELWSNNKPIFMVVTTNSVSKIYFPIFVRYQPDKFGIQDAFIVDYKEFTQNNPNVFAIFPINRWGAEEQSDKFFAPPQKTHWLGTDNLGRDITARLLYGIRISLGFAIALWLISYTLGIFLGSLQGYFLGFFDFILERFKELTTIIPTLTLIVLVTTITKGQSFVIMLFLLSFLGWMGISHQVRTQALSLRQRDFCEAGKAMGGGHLWVIRKHIIPNILTPVITLSPFAIETGISLLATLDYLGSGLPPPVPSIGELLAQGRDNIQNAPWVLISPIVAVLILLVSVSLIGQALRNAFDPKS